VEIALDPIYRDQINMENSKSFIKLTGGQYPPIDDIDKKNKYRNKLPKGILSLVFMDADTSINASDIENIDTLIVIPKIPPLGMISGFIRARNGIKR